MAMSEQVWTTAVLGMFGLLTTIVTSITALLTLRIKANSTEAVVEAKETRKAAKETAVATEEIHKAVNHDRELLVVKLDELTQQVLNLSKDKAKLEEAAKQDKGGAK